METIVIGGHEWIKLPGGGTKTPYEHLSTRQLVVYTPNHIGLENWERIVREEFATAAVLKALGFLCLDLELVRVKLSTDITGGQNLPSFLSLASKSFHAYGVEGENIIDTKIQRASTWRALHPKSGAFLFINQKSLDATIAAAMRFIRPLLNDVIKSKQLGVRLPPDSLNAIIFTSDSSMHQKQPIPHIPFVNNKYWWTLDSAGKKYGPLDSAFLNARLLDNQLDLNNMLFSLGEFDELYPLIYYFDRNLTNPFTGQPINPRSYPKLVESIEQSRANLSAEPYARLFLFDLTSKTRANLVTWTGHVDPDLTFVDIRDMLSRIIPAILYEVSAENEIITEILEPGVTKRSVEIVCDALGIYFDPYEYDKAE